MKWLFFGNKIRREDKFGNSESILDYSFDARIM
jgi:hypothetical protein